MKVITLSILLLLFTLSIKAQSPGDTVLIHSFNYSQTYGSVWDGTIRDTAIMFPTSSAISYEKVLMYYSIRCKDALVSPPISGQTNKGCGEWDYSCNTYIHDSTRIDSSYSKHSNYSISNFSGNLFNYVINPMNSYYQYIQKDVTVSGTPADTQSTVGSGSLANTELIYNGGFNAKRQYLFTAAELISAGVSAGSIDGISLNVLNGGNYARFFKLNLKQTLDTVLTNQAPNNTGFTEAYFHNTNLQSGSNVLQFYTPFAWDGVSSIIVEYSYYNTQATTSISFEGSSLSQNMAMLSTDDNSFTFNGINYIETDSYKGISGTTPRTVEAWIKTEYGDKEIVSWGTNQGGKKWVFRLNGNGALRVEVNGGYAYGSTLLHDNQWHHVVCTFQGSDVNDIKLYVDGVLETNLTQSNIAINTDTAAGINLRISRGINNRYWDGLIDEVRIWDVALSGSTIQDWMYSTIDNSHPMYSNLQMYYQFDDFQNGSINDMSANTRNAHSIDGGDLSIFKGFDLFKSWQTSQNRPNTTFLQGNYSLTITNDTILDTMQMAPNNVIEYQVVNNYATIYSDEIVQILDTSLWQAGYENTYDAISGAILNTQNRPADGALSITDLTYTRRAPMKFEIMSFVTPYGINLDLGQDGKTFTFDVTDFMPMLKGEKRITVEGGGQWQEDMDITFAFIVGTPPRDIINIQQLWPVHSIANADILSDKAFEPRDVLLDATAKYFKIRSSITGHGQQGEFIPRLHHIDIDGGTNEFTWQVWKDDCAANPIYPQGGTWIYNRAGWCPGAATNIEQSDITQYVTPGLIANIDYGMASATGTSKYWVNNQLVTYGDNNFNLDVAVIDILTPSSKIENHRENMICTSPTIMIRNTGATSLSSVVVEYWINDASNRQTYTWNGFLATDEETEITLIANDELWSSLNPTGNVFRVEVKSPNGGADEYSHNNTYNSNFEIPDVLPNEFIVQFRTNHAGNETSYRISNSNGIVFEKSNLTADTYYRDTINLSIGCYKLEILDTDDDGLSFFANNDGSGFFRMRTISNGYLKNFEADFGRSLVYNFTVDYPLSYEQMNAMTKTSEVYPNPNNGSFNIKFGNITPNKVIVLDMLGKIVYQKNISNNYDELLKVNLGDKSKGIYIVQLQYADKVEQHKIVVD